MKTFILLIRLPGAGKSTMEWNHSKNCLI